MEQKDYRNSYPPSQDMLAALDSGFAQRVTQLEDGAQIAYRSGGSAGPVIVLLHGISSGAASWLPCASLLAAHARVIAWDAPGYGDSSPLSQAQPRAADYAERLREWLRTLGVRPDLIVGHSLGALMAAAYVAGADEAGLPDRLLLLSVAQGYGGPGKEDKAREVERQRLDALTSLGVEGLAERGPGRLLSAGANAGAQDWVRWNMRRLRPDGYRQAVAMLCGDDIDAYLASARPPCRRASPAAATTSSPRRWHAACWPSASTCRSRNCPMPGTLATSTRPPPRPASSATRFPSPPDSPFPPGARHPGSTFRILRVNPSQFLNHR